jgi:hypothetical protein
MTPVQAHRAGTGSGRVTFTRTDSADVQQRQIYVRLDDGPSHALLFGNTMTVDVPPGDHILRANNTLFWKKIPFAIAADQHIEFSLINRAGAVGFGLLSLLGVALLTLSIEQRSLSISDRV